MAGQDDLYREITRTPGDKKFYVSNYSDKVCVISAKDVHQKLYIARAIVGMCKDRSQKKKKVVETKDTILTLLTELANFPMHTLNNLYKTIHLRDRSFKKAIRDSETLTPSSQDEIRVTIRDMFVEYHLGLNKLPNKLEVLNYLLMNSTDITIQTISIQCLIKNNLLKYHHVKKFNRYLLCEHPETVSKRTLYLKKVKEHRSLGRNIVYVEVREIWLKGDWDRKLELAVGIAAFPETGEIIEKFENDFSGEKISEWLQEMILPRLHENNVVLLYYKEYSKELSPNSSKAELIEWLNANHFSWDPGYHKADLYTLYEKLKHKENKRGRYDGIFLKEGVLFINVPFEWPNLKFFDVFWTQIEKTTNSKTNRNKLKDSIVSCVSRRTKTLNEMEYVLIEQEDKMMKDDATMEDIIDNLMLMIRNGDIHMRQLPQDCTGDKTDYLEMHIGNILFD